MAKGNGKTDVKNLDLEHELPPAENNEDTAEVPVPGAAQKAPVSEVEKLRGEREALLDRLARLQAEFDNARKRAQREQQEFREYAAADVIKSILPVLDSFERALRAPAGQANDFRSGIELIYRQFLDALQKAGVQPIQAVGQPFDPRLHEAIEMVDTSEVEDHRVLDELQRGYKYKDRLLRPAMVRVARNNG
jgi:molecular chaperone GrpE